MKASEIRSMSLREAEEKVLEIKSSLAKERAVQASGTRPENPGKTRFLRRQIARFLTIINERKRKGEVAAAKQEEKKPKEEKKETEKHKEKAAVPEKEKKHEKNQEKKETEKHSEKAHEKNEVKKVLKKNAHKKEAKKK